MIGFISLLNDNAALWDMSGITWRHQSARNCHGSDNGWTCEMLSNSWHNLKQNLTEFSHGLMYVVGEKSKENAQVNVLCN